MVSIMMKPAPSPRGKYLVFAGLAPNDREQLCSIRAANIQAADKALLKILSKALDGLDIDANGPADPPAPANDGSNTTDDPPAPANDGSNTTDDPPAPADGGSNTTDDVSVGAAPALTAASFDPSPDPGTGGTASSPASAEDAP